MMDGMLMIGGLLLVIGVDVVVGGGIVVMIAVGAALQGWGCGWRVHDGLFRSKFGRLVCISFGGGR